MTRKSAAQMRPYPRHRSNTVSLTKAQISAIVSAVIAFVVAILAVFGYNVAVVQPQLEQLMTLAASCP